MMSFLEPNKSKLFFRHFEKEIRQKAILVKFSDEIFLRDIAELTYFSHAQYDPDKTVR